MGPRGRSPGGPSSPIWGGRAPSANSGRSNDGRPLSYVDLANVSYPQAPPAPISMDNSQLRSVVGSNASLLSTQQTLDMYRQNIKKLNDAETQYAFAIFLIQAAQEAGLNQDGGSTPRKLSPKPGNRDLDSPYIDKPQSSPQELVNEAKNILQKLSDRGYPFAQYYLADGYASGLFSKGKEDYGTAFPLFVSASKHGHAESGYRAALCYEFGWGSRKDPAKAVQFYRQSASKNHPGAMTRLGRACLSGDLGMNKYREGLTWLKRATESADVQYNAAPYHLGILYETGYGDDVFMDEAYTAQLFTQAADLGHAEACYRMGDAYEHGKLSCPRDPALSVHFYTGAAQRGHPLAMMALCAWYMVGAPPVLEKDENEAYEWARQAAELGEQSVYQLFHHHPLMTVIGLTKAEYAVGYFTEMGIGTRRDPLEANVWYVKAADAGDERAKHRLAAIRAAAEGGTPMEVASPRNGAKVKKSSSGNEKTGQTEKDCIVM
jgi:TPR repeat protein